MGVMVQSKQRAQKEWWRMLSHCSRLGLLHRPGKHRASWRWERAWCTPSSHSLAFFQALKKTPWWVLTSDSVQLCYSKCCPPLSGPCSTSELVVASGAQPETYWVRLCHFSTLKGIPMHMKVGQVKTLISARKENANIPKVPNLIMSHCSEPWNSSPALRPRL